MRGGAEKGFGRLPRGLGAKLFVSHLLVVLVAVLTLLTAALVVAPIIIGVPFVFTPISHPTS